MTESNPGAPRSPQIFRAGASARTQLPTRRDAGAILRSPHLLEALATFSRISGLTLSVYDANFERVALFFPPSPLGELFRSADSFEKQHGRAHAIEKELALECVSSLEVAQHRALDAMPLASLPLVIEERCIGAIVVGWAFDSFVDTLVTKRVADELDLGAPGMWQAVRTSQPIGKEKYALYLNFLGATLSAFLGEQRESRMHQLNARVLDAVLEGQRSLARATGRADVKAGLRKALTQLLETQSVSLWMSDAAQAAAIGFASEGGDDTERMHTVLRIPIYRAEGVPMGFVEVEDAVGPVAISLTSEISSLVVAGCSVLERLKLLGELRENALRLERSNEAKDQFLSVLSHELRTPLSPILVWAQLLQRPGSIQNPAMQAQGLAAIERNALQELALIDEMLDLSRILNEKLVLALGPVLPSEVVHQAVSNAMTQPASQDLHFKIEVEANLPSLNADANRLQQMLGNLMTNAIKFTGKGGTITVGAKMRVEGSARTIEFFVADTGIGISSDKLSLIFERFEQADSSTTRRFGGLGIGLSVVKGLALLHGGSVRAESEGENRGATLTICLPLAPSKTRSPALGTASLQPSLPQASAHEAPDVYGAPLPTRQRHILIVDDIEDTREVLSLGLGCHGYKVTTTGTVDDALRILDTEAVDLVISDLGMPGQDGFDLVRLARAAGPEGKTVPPFVAVSGFTGGETKARVLAEGFCAHIAKPVALDALYRCLNDLLEPATVPTNGSPAIEAFPLVSKQ